MQLEKMKLSFFRRVLTLSTPRIPGGNCPPGIQTIDKPIFPVWGCMKGPQPLHIFAPASAYAGPGFRFANNVCEPPAAHSAAFEIRSGGMYAARTRPKWPLPCSFRARKSAGF